MRQPGRARTRRREARPGDPRAKRARRGDAVRPSTRSARAPSASSATMVRIFSSKLSMAEIACSRPCSRAPCGEGIVRPRSVQRGKRLAQALKRIAGCRRCVEPCRRSLNDASACSSPPVARSSHACPLPAQRPARQTSGASSQANRRRPPLRRALAVRSSNDASAARVPPVARSSHACPLPAQRRARQTSGASSRPNRRRPPLRRPLP